MNFNDGSGQFNMGVTVKMAIPGHKSRPEQSGCQSGTVPDIPGRLANMVLIFLLIVYL